jgi:hypothetical protein
MSFVRGGVYSLACLFILAFPIRESLAIATRGNYASVRARGTAGACDDAAPVRKTIGVTIASAGRAQMTG